MRENTIPPAIARLLVGEEDAMSGSGKMLYCEHGEKTLFGGLVKPNLSKPGESWKMSIGTLIWVPCQNYVWKDDICGWLMEDLLRDGLDMKHWNKKE